MKFSGASRVSKVVPTSPSEGILNGATNLCLNWTLLTATGDSSCLGCIVHLVLTINYNVIII